MIAWTKAADFWKLPPVKTTPGHLALVCIRKTNNSAHNDGIPGAQSHTVADYIQETFTRKYSCYSVLAAVSQIVSALIDALTGPESNLYARKMIPSILTSNSDHTRSRLHGKHHIRFLDSFRLYNLYSLYNIVPKSSWVTIRSSLCFELEQIRDHFYYKNF